MRLSPLSVKFFPGEMKKAICEGNEETFAQVFSKPSYWKPSETYMSGDNMYSRRIPNKAAEFLAYTEFNTWYIRGFTRRLIEEGEKYCQVYRAAPAWEPRDECLRHEGKIYWIRDIHNGHRVRYWPSPGDPNTLAIPVCTNYHHSIRRIK